MQQIIPRKVHKSLPAFSPHSSRSFKVFAKKYPKNVRKLDIGCRIGRFLESDKRKKIMMNLTKLIKRSPKFKTIQGASLSNFLNTRAQALYIIKKSYRVHSLGLIWDFCNMKIQNETRKWLKYTNRLQSLSFQQIEKGGNHRTVFEAGNLNMKLARDLRRRKITKLIYSVLPSKFYAKDHYILNMSNYPATIQELSLDLSASNIHTDARLPMSRVFSMQKFFALTKLELLFPLETEKILMLLRTIPNPHLLTSLGLYLLNNSPKHDEQDLTPILDFIADCPELEKLCLRMIHLTHKIGILSRLLSQYRLRILNLWVSAKTDKHLQDLGDVISNSVNLENLDVTVSFSSDSIYQKTFVQFYQGISQLTRLRKLSLNFTSQDNLRIKPAYPKLMNCLGGLGQLEELSLYVFDVSLHLEFPSILEGLEKIAHQLKKFSMDFMGDYFGEKDEMRLIDVLRKMKGLRELRIERFSFKQSYESLLRFRDVLQGCQELKKFVWKSFEFPKKAGEILFEMMTSILAKRGVEEVKFINDQPYEIYQNSREILFEEILERNPELRVVFITSLVVSNDWYSYPFENCKYQ